MWEYGCLAKFNWSFMRDDFCSVARGCQVVGDKIPGNPLLLFFPPLPYKFTPFIFPLPSVPIPDPPRLFPSISSIPNPHPYFQSFPSLPSPFPSPYLPPYSQPVGLIKLARRAANMSKLQIRFVICLSV